MATDKELDTKAIDAASENLLKGYKLSDKDREKLKTMVEASVDTEEGEAATDTINFVSIQPQDEFQLVAVVNGIKQSEAEIAEAKAKGTYRAPRPNTAQKLISTSLGATFGCRQLNSIDWGDIEHPRVGRSILDLNLFILWCDNHNIWFRAQSIWTEKRDGGFDRKHIQMKAIKKDKATDAQQQK